MTRAAVLAAIVAACAQQRRWDEAKVITATLARPR